MARPNEEVMREAVGYFVKGDVESVMSMFADDVVLHIPGSTQVSGDHKGKEGFQAFLGKTMELTNGQFQLTPHDILGSDEHAVGIYNIKATRDGKDFEWRHVNVYHIRDEKIAEIFYTPHDFPAWHEFWS